MERTRTTGISIEAGCRIIDKRYKGQRIYARLGEVSQEEAEAYLAKRINEVRAAKLFGESPRRTFREAAMKHLLEEKQRLAQKFGISSDGALRPKGQKQLDDKARHLKLLDRFVGHLALDEICDDTLESFISQRYHDGVAAKTVRLSLEQVRRILNKAARTWRKNNQPWLRLQPPVITMPKGEPRAPFPITRAEERALFSELPLHLADMCLFKVNTGLREAEVCELRWEWERKLDEGISVFLIPPAHHKGGDYNRYRLVVPNSIVRAVVEAQRGKHPEFVFVSPKSGKPLKRINNNPFRAARKAVGITQCRVHDLKHTFGERLQAAGVSHEHKQILLGHRLESITTHYSMPRIQELLDAAEKVVGVVDSASLVRVVGGSGEKSHANLTQQAKATRFA